MSRPAVTHERRGHARIPVRRLQVECRPGGWLKGLVSPGFPGKAVAINLSGGGMRLLVSQPRRAGDTLSFRLQGARMSQHIRLSGRVTRCRGLCDQASAKAGHLYELGIRLTRAGEDYHALVAAFRKDPLLSQGF